MQGAGFSSISLKCACDFDVAAPVSVAGHPITMGSEVNSGAGSPLGSVQGHPITFQSGSELGSPIGSATNSPLGGWRQVSLCKCAAGHCGSQQQCYTPSHHNRAGPFPRRVGMLFDQQPSSTVLYLLSVER